MAQQPDPALYLYRVLALPPSLPSKDYPKMETIQCSKPGLNTMCPSVGIAKQVKS
jgi:hypothetical protein